MKKLFITIGMLCFLPVAAFGHPGKTDVHGGHKCIKDCEEWGLYYAEYHLHDKEGRPIRISRKKYAPAQVMQSVATETTATTTPPITLTTQTVTVYRTIATVYEEDVFTSNPLLWALVVLLFLLLILYRKRREPQNS